MLRLNVRLPSSSADAARQREQVRVSRASVMERMVKALVLGRRCRQLRNMLQPPAPRGRG